MIRLLSAAGILLAGSLSAATITYDLSEQTGGEKANVNVVFSDTAVPGAILGRVSVDPDAADANVGDIRAIFFNLQNLVSGVTPATVLAAITGADITDTAINTNTLGSQTNINPLGTFDIGLEFGTPGIGKDDIPLTAFLINDPNLTLQNLGSVAVRVTSIGGPGSERGGGGKFFDAVPTYNAGGGDAPGGVPEPATCALAGTALLGLGWLRRWRRS